MKVVLDLDSHSAIQDFGNKSPAGVYQFKSQDTVEWELYFVQGGVVQDFGTGFALKFGMIKTGDTTNTLLAYQTAFTHLTDASGNVYYSGLVNFNTSQMASAIGTLSSIPGTVEIRYQDSLNEIIHTINIATVVYATIIVETGVTPPGVASGYPDASTIELLVHKNAVNGYAGLDSLGDIAGSVIPVDTQTIVVNANGDIASAAILATATAGWTTPASGANVTVTVDSTTNLKALSYVRIPVAGYYIVESITDSTHAVLQNNGDPFNAASGVTVASGTVLLPAQAAAGGGAAGQNAFTTTTAAFTVPAVGAAVTINVGSTAWMGGAGYGMFISGAGYYLVSSIIDSTHVSATNSGSAANAILGTNVASGSSVSAAGPMGPQGANGQSLAAYDTVSSSFTMPNAAASVNVVLTNSTAWMAANQVVYIAGAGYFQVASIINATNVSLTNLNYPGNAAAASTIAAGAHIGPGGLQGAAGAGGAGLNAFTTLSAGFTQPAGGSAVTITVGTTAWMAANQVIYIAGGGYYNVTTIADLTHASVTNLGYAGNGNPGLAIPSGAAVTPGGVIGQSGANPYTATSASFTMPAVGNSVTVPVNSTAFMVSGQNLFVQNAGYMTVSSVTDAGHVVLTNNGAAGNTSSGATIPSGSSVATAGANGATGAAGSPGPAGRDGAYSTVYTGDSVAGTGGSATPVILVNDVAQGTNPYAIYQRDVSGNNLWGPIPTDGTTITVSAGKLTVLSAPGGGGQLDPKNGLFITDDLFIGLAAASPIGPYAWATVGVGTINFASTYGVDSIKKVNGSVELHTGGSSGANSGEEFFHGWGAAAAPWGSIPFSLGAMVWKTRVFIEGTLPAAGIGYIFRAGIGGCISGTSHNGTPLPGFEQGFAFCYSPDNNSGQWQIYIGTTTPVAVNTTVAVAGDTAYWLECDVNAAWNSFTFYINGTLVATVTTGLPTIGGNPFWNILRGTASTTNFAALIDSWYLNYQFSR